MVCGAVLRLGCGRRPLVAWARIFAFAVGTFLGNSRRAAAIQPTLRTRPGSNGSPAMVALFASSFEHFLYVFILYGGIVVIDELLLQPVIMRRTAQVPIWTSLIVPIPLSILLGFR